MTCGGETTWFGFAKEIFVQQAESKPPQIIPIPSREYPVPAMRPANSVLSNRKLQSFWGIALPDWQTALSETMTALKPEGGIPTGSRIR
jgi:dTDP-4-dehydrorhamnose reductase